MLTALVSDLAELFGCIFGVPDIVTAITFVALGTSMPDLFASRTAAVAEPTADAAIVNVTGSNSVNVFLGLGIPWTIASMYWPLIGRTPEWEARYPDVASRISGAAFVVESRNLGFSVLVYCGCSLVATILLVMRRKMIGAVLGGPFWPKVATGATFVWLWFGFVCLTSWRVMRWTVASVLESVLVIGAVIILNSLVSLWPMVTITLHWWRQRNVPPPRLTRSRTKHTSEGGSSSMSSLGSQEMKQGRTSSQESNASEDLDVPTADAPDLVWPSEEAPDDPLDLVIRALDVGLGAVSDVKGRVQK